MFANLKSGLEQSVAINRGDLSNEKWERLQPILPPQKPHTGYPANNYHPIVNGILWILRTRATWADLPERYGKWITVSSRFYRQCNKVEHLTNRLKQFRRIAIRYEKRAANVAAMRTLAMIFLWLSLSLHTHPSQ